MVAKHEGSHYYYVKICPVCQRNKRRQKKYGLLPPKEAEATPWDKLCVEEKAFAFGTVTLQQLNLDRFVSKRDNSSALCHWCGRVR
jgi:hypothetical protein